MTESNVEMVITEDLAKLLDLHYVPEVADLSAFTSDDLFEVLKDPRQSARIVDASVEIEKNTVIVERIPDVMQRIVVAAIYVRYMDEYDKYASKHLN